MSTNAKKANLWSLGLLNNLKDTKCHIISSNAGIVINDKFPKARYHYLVLPKENIPDIFHLQKTHLPLLVELHLLGQNVIEVKRLNRENFKIGFHAQPSMQQLHLHVISTDFDSECLKTKKHWNSFNTPLFLPYENLCDELRKNGCIKRLVKEEVQRLSDTELACNQCEFVAKNMPKLKEHLRQHANIDNKP